jgi:AcrR family transcriptional regulator
VPTPSRTSVEAIVEAGRAILDERGLDALTMQAVAAAVGVRAPSLYKRVQDRDALVRLIAQAVVTDLGEALDAAADTGTPRSDLRAIAFAFRAWAHAHPGGFALLFAPIPDAWRLPPDAGSRALDAMFRTVAALAGPDEVLEAARTVVAWSGGFVSMELAGAFKLGDDVDAAYAFGVERLATAISGVSR